MKFSAAALSLSVAALASAKSVRNSYPVRREGSQVTSGQSVSFQNGLSGFGVTDTSLVEVLLIWVNPGAGAATTTLNQQVTVTQTVTVNGGGAAGGVAAPTPEAGTPTPPQAATSVIVGGGQTHPVTVGGPAGLIFTPDNIKAAVGDVVIFTFLGNNHTATQSAFSTPCDPLAGGMDSGFMGNPNSTVIPAPQVAMQVMVTEPLWFYCKQNAHCGKGMTFSINPTAEKSQALFQQLAIQQKGAGAGSAITGGAPAAAPPAAAPVAPPAESAALQPLPAASNGAVAPVAGAPSGIISGSGTINADGSCTCAVSCGAGGFPAIGVQGVGSFGGVGSALPMNMVEA